MLDFTNDINRTYSTINVFYSMVGGGNAEAAFLTETAAMCLSGPWTFFQAQNSLVDAGIGLRDSLTNGISEVFPLPLAVNNPA